MTLSASPTLTGLSLTAEAMGENAEELHRVVEWLTKLEQYACGEDAITQEVAELLVQLGIQKPGQNDELEGCGAPQSLQNSFNLAVWEILFANDFLESVYKVIERDLNGPDYYFGDDEPCGCIAAKTHLRQLLDFLSPTPNPEWVDYI